MLRKLIPLTALFVLGVAGSTFAQDASRSTSAASGNADSVEAMTCADLNEMKPEKALAFLSGYKYAMTAASRLGASGTASSGEAGSASSSSATPVSAESSAASAEVGQAATTGDVARDAAADEGSTAILNSCFDAPSMSLDEVLSGAYGTLD